MKMKKLLLIAALFIPLSMYTAPVVYSELKLKKSEIECLAKNVYHEARGESLEGQIAVAAVTINRVNAKGFPSTVCEVVHQPRQFSWVHQLSDHSARNKKSYETALWVAMNTLHGHFKDPTGGATYYHSTKVKPKWAGSFEITAKIGNHNFYRN